MYKYFFVLWHNIFLKVNYFFIIPDTIYYTVSFFIWSPRFILQTFLQNKSYSPSFLLRLYPRFYPHSSACIYPINGKTLTTGNACERQNEQKERVFWDPVAQIILTLNDKFGKL